MLGAGMVVLFCLGLCLQGGLSETTETRKPPSKIAIIGAGIGGTSAAYFVRQKFGNSVAIDIFEQGEVGGRLATLEIGGKEYEAGGTVLHPLNLHMKKFVKELGLSTRPVPNSLVGIFNGKEFVFEQSSWFIINLVKIIWYYGLNFMHMLTWVEEKMDKFMRVYDYQTADYAFRSTESMLRALGGEEFVDLLNKTIDETMQEEGFSQKFIKEIVTPGMRLYYDQEAEINGFVGTLALTSSDPGHWSVEGGNKMVCKGLLYASKANLIKGTVTSVEEQTRNLRSGDDSVQMYQVNYYTDSSESYSQYDIVLVATPLNPGMSNISFPIAVPDCEKRYHQAVVTFVQGQINTTFFGCPQPCELGPTQIFTTENPDLFFFSICVANPVKGPIMQPSTKPAGDPVWKLFSSEPLTKQQLGLLFVSHGEVRSKTWLAYPHYNPPERLPPTILHEGIYYVSGFEMAASAIEMNVLSAKNVALLAYHQWYGKYERIDQETLNEKHKSEL